MCTYLLRQRQSKQYCFLTSEPQQSPPSKLQKGLLLASSHEPSDIQAVCPAAFTENILDHVDSLRFMSIHDMKI